MKSQSPRFSAAVKFGELLTRRMASRKVGQHVVKAAAGVSRASIVEMRNGRNLPTLAVALRLAEALEEPRLAEIVRKARTIQCVRCGRDALNEAGFPKRYCSTACRILGTPVARDNRAKADEAVQILRRELLRMGPARKQQIGRAATLVEEYRVPEKDALAAVDAYQDAVAAMCAACEPDGLCRTAECPLRGVSPLPLESRHVDVNVAVKPDPWASPERHQRFSAALHRRWAQPGARAAQAEKSRGMWAAMSDEERAAMGAKISERRRTVHP